ncbi:oxidoreductase [Flavobacterium magnum]|uniref:Oxidoreductase n=1 Tax=Flavobacterium magnum TaxID=2162713 RepID=A0A2S0RCT8_9FLAO|nr:SDR family oxidoreductase [Flavobacterium magnum]AWA29425.1 oxidoreductase [Flavobacterium magnum]
MNDQKKYLIAGASSGIGREICQKLLDDGCHIIAIGRSPENLPQHSALEFIRHDFMLDEPLPDIDGTLDGMVYTPGSINLKPLSSVKESDILDDFRINVLGAFRLISKYRRNLSETSHPGIVLFSSVAAEIGMPFHTSISISKAAVQGLTKSLAAEFAPKVRVNCIAPSLTDTPLAKMLLNSDAKRQSGMDRHPLKRIGSAEDIADLAIYLLNAGWMTGQVVHIDGGLGTIMK